MIKYHDKVKVVCTECQKEHDNEMYYGEIEKYPDDFYMTCKHCNNSEEGSAPTQSFDIVEFYERVETI